MSRNGYCVYSLTLVNPTAAQFVGRADNMRALVNNGRRVRWADAAWLASLAGPDRAGGRLLRLGESGGQRSRSHPTTVAGGRWPILGVAWWYDRRRNLHVRLVVVQGAAMPRLFGRRFEGDVNYPWASCELVYPGLGVPLPNGVFFDRDYAGARQAAREDPLGEAHLMAMIDLAQERELLPEYAVTSLRLRLRAARQVNQAVASNPAIAGCPGLRTYWVSATASVVGRNVVQSAYHEHTLACSEAEAEIIVRARFAGTRGGELLNVRVDEVRVDQLST